jgi:hypothetical protein
MRWNDRVAGDDCRKGKEGSGTGVCRRWKNMVVGREGGIWDGGLLEGAEGGGFWNRGGLQ